MIRSTEIPEWPARRSYDPYHHRPREMLTHMTRLVGTIHALAVDPDGGWTLYRCTAEAAVLDHCDWAVLRAGRPVEFPGWERLPELVMEAML